MQPVCTQPPHIPNACVPKDPSTTAENSEDEAGLLLNSESDDESGMMHCIVDEGDTMLSRVCTSSDEACISFESDQETNPSQDMVEQNSSMDEAGLSLESSTDQVTFSDNCGDGFETVQAVLPKKKHISNFVLCMYILFFFLIITVIKENTCKQQLL